MKAPIADCKKPEMPKDWMQGIILGNRLARGPCVQMNIAGRAPAPVEGNLERLTRLELALRAWKALVLPLHHSR